MTTAHSYRIAGFIARNAPGDILKEDTITPRFHPPRGRRRALILSPVVLGLAVLIGAPASAAGAGSLTPFVDCITVDAATGDVTAYFGYSNTLGAAETFAIGENNQVFPTVADQGQPTTFDEGTFPQVFSVTFDPVIIPSIAWIVDGQETDATTQSQACVSGVTSPPTGITASTAVLDGVVVPSGPGATYSFDYGTSTAMPSNTGPQPFTGSQPGLVQAPLSGLLPNTTYYARIDTQTGSVTTQGQILSFTTPAAAPLEITTTRLPDATTGTQYTAQLTGTGGIGPYAWKVTSGSLPAGFSLDSATGIVSGTAEFKGTAHFAVSLYDKSQPTAKAAVRNLSLTVNAPCKTRPSR